MNNSFQRARCSISAEFGRSARGGAVRPLTLAATGRVICVAAVVVWLAGCSSQHPVPDEREDGQMESAAERKEHRTSSSEQIYSFETAHRERYGDKFMPEPEPTDDSTEHQSE